MEDLGISADYDNILFFLSKKNVEYLIVGGVGVRYYVKNREARDLDILINNTSSNIMLLQHAFHDFGIERLPSQKPYVLDGDNIKKLGDFKTLLTLSIFIFKIDIFTPTKPNIFNEIYTRKNSENIRGIPIAFPSLIDLIKMKKEDDINDQQKKMKNLKDIQLLEEKLLGSTSN